MNREPITLHNLLMRARLQDQKVAQNYFYSLPQIRSVFSQCANVNLQVIVTKDPPILTGLCSLDQIFRAQKTKYIKCKFIW